MHPYDLNACPTSRAHLISCISTYPQRVLVAHAQLLPAVHIRVRPDMPALLQRLLLYAWFRLLNSLLLRPPAVAHRGMYSCVARTWGPAMHRGHLHAAGGTSAPLGEPPCHCDMWRGACDAHLILCPAEHPRRRVCMGAARVFSISLRRQYEFSGLHALRRSTAGVGGLRPCAGSLRTDLTRSAQIGGVGGLLGNQIQCCTCADHSMQDRGECCCAGEHPSVAGTTCVRALLSVTG